MASVSKQAVRYRDATGSRKCATCVMFHPRSRTCDLVKGAIRPDGVCDRWEKK